MDDLIPLGKVTEEEIKASIKRLDEDTRTCTGGINNKPKKITRRYYFFIDLSVVSSTLTLFATYLEEVL